MIRTEPFNQQTPIDAIRDPGLVSILRGVDPNNVCNVVNLFKNNINPTLMHIEVPETGLAVVRGISIARQMKERIISVVRSVPEITEVKSEISVIDQGYS